MKFITVLAAALVAKASATAVCPSNSTDLANMNPLLRMKASVVSFDSRAEVFLSGLSTEPVENNGTVGAPICPGVGLNCCGEKNFQLIADMYQSIANETNNEISEFSSSIDLLQGPLQTAADGIRTTADMLSKSVIFKDLAKPIYQSLNSLSDTLTSFSRSYKGAVMKCIAHGKVFWKVGMACAACEANWDTWYNATGASVKINRNQIDQLATACTDLLVDLENVGSSYGNVFSTLTSGFLGGSSTVQNELCEAKDDCPASMTATTTADRCKANLVCRLEDDDEHLEGPRVHELFEYVQEKLTAISVEGETQSSAALVTVGQMADDQQGGRRSAEELAYHMREGLRNVREIARRALEMVATGSSGTIQYSNDPSSLQPVTAGQQSSLTVDFQSSGSATSTFRAFYVFPAACVAALLFL